MFDSIIFDIDGTIWDSTEVVAKGYNTVFEKENLEERVTADELKKLFGRTMDEIFAVLFPDTSEEMKNKLQRECIRQEDELLKNTSGRFYDGIIDTIEKLSRKYPLYIVSNAQCGYIETVMKHGKLEKYFKGHLCFGDTGVSKGGTLKILMEKEGLTDPVYIGDIQGDADACRQAGIEIIYAAYGFGMITKPYAAIQRPNQLLEIL